MRRLRCEQACIILRLTRSAREAGLEAGSGTTSGTTLGQHPALQLLSQRTAVVQEFFHVVHFRETHTVHYSVGSGALHSLASGRTPFSVGWHSEPRAALRVVLRPPLLRRGSPATWLNGRMVTAGP